MTNNYPTRTNPYILCSFQSRITLGLIDLRKTRRLDRSNTIKKQEIRNQHGQKSPSSVTLGNTHHNKKKSQFLRQIPKSSKKISLRRQIPKIQRVYAIIPGHTKHQFLLISLHKSLQQQNKPQLKNPSFPQSCTLYSRSAFPTSWSNLLFTQIRLDQDQNQRN